MVNLSVAVNKISPLPHGILSEANVHCIMIWLSHRRNMCYLKSLDESSLSLSKTSHSERLFIISINSSIPTRTLEYLLILIKDSDACEMKGINFEARVSSNLIGRFFKFFLNFSDFWEQKITNLVYEKIKPFAIHLSHIPGYILEFLL